MAQLPGLVGPLDPPLLEAPRSSGSTRSKVGKNTFCPIWPKFGTLPHLDILHICHYCLDSLGLRIPLLGAPRSSGSTRSQVGKNMFCPIWPKFGTLPHLDI